MPPRLMAPPCPDGGHLLLDPLSGTAALTRSRRSLSIILSFSLGASVCGGAAAPAVTPCPGAVASGVWTRHGALSCRWWGTERVFHCLSFCRGKVSGHGRLFRHWTRSHRGVISGRECHGSPGSAWPLAQVMGLNTSGPQLCSQIITYL